MQFITGSIEGKAKIKEALVPYIIGCIVVFGAFFIWRTLVNTGNSLEGDTQDATEWEQGGSTAHKKGDSELIQGGGGGNY